MRKFLVGLRIGTMALSTLFMVCGSTVQSQEPLHTRFRPTFTLEPDVRLREEARTSSAFAPGNDPQDAYNRIRLGMRLRTSQGITLYLQPQFSYENHWGVLGAMGTQNDFDIHQGFVELPTANGRFRLGRQELAFGEERLISAGYWGSIGRSFDALRWTFTSSRTQTDLFLGKLGQAANKTSEPILFGIYSTLRSGKTDSADAYLLLKADRVSGSRQEVWTLGARPKFTFGKGFDASFEGAMQFGRNAGKPISAWAYSANIGYTLPGKAGWRIAIERNAASGGDPADAGGYHTFDQLFAGNHSYYGITDFVGWRNMENWRLSLKGKLTSRWTLSLDGHLFRMQNSRDYWYGDNGRPVKGMAGNALRDATGAAGRDLGAEIDILLNYAVTRNLGIQFGYGRFMPGSFVRQTNQGCINGSDWIFIQPSFRF